MTVGLMFDKKKEVEKIKKNKKYKI